MLGSEQTISSLGYQLSLRILIHVLCIASLSLSSQVLLHASIQIFDTLTLNPATSFDFRNGFTGTFFHPLLGEVLLRAISCSTGRGSGGTYLENNSLMKIAFMKKGVLELEDLP